VRHPILDYVLSTPDRLTDDGGVMEVKYIGLRMAHRWLDEDSPPDDVVAQATWHMIATRRQHCYVGGLCGTDFKPYRVELNDDLSAALLEIAERFWKDHVLAECPPMADGTPGSGDALRALFPRSIGTMLQAGPEAETLVQRYFAARERREQAELEEERAKQGLQGLIGDADGLVGRGFRVTWKTAAAGPIAWKAIAESLNPSPELVAAHRGPPSRRFDAKLAKGTP
jgi:predicted phage-related endonuclease